MKCKTFAENSEFSKDVNQKSLHFPCSYGRHKDLCSDEDDETQAHSDLTDFAVEETSWRVHGAPSVPVRKETAGTAVEERPALSCSILWAPKNQPSTLISLASLRDLSENYIKSLHHREQGLSVK